MSQEPISKDDLIIEHNQNLRRRISDKLMEKGVPNNSDDLKLLLQVIDGMDRTALTNKRLKTEDRIADIAAQEAMIISNLLADRSPDLFNGISRKPRQVPLVDRVSDYKPSPGEMGMDPETVTYGDIMTGSPEEESNG